MKVLCKTEYENALYILMAIVGLNKNPKKHSSTLAVRNFSATTYVITAFTVGNCFDKHIIGFLFPIINNAVTSASVHLLIKLKIKGKLGAMKTEKKVG